MFFKRFIIALSLAIFPITAYAGDFTNQKYTSHLGYTITAPKNWTRLDASTVQAMKDNLPQNIDSKAIERFDVIFFPSVKDNTQVDFAPTISILAIAEKPSSTTPETIKAYSDAIVESIQKKLESVRDITPFSFTMEPLSGGDSLLYHYIFSHNGRTLSVKQSIVLNKEYTLIITCTQDSNENDSQLCHTVINTLKFSTP